MQDGYTMACTHVSFLQAKRQASSAFHVLATDIAVFPEQCVPAKNSKRIANHAGTGGEGTGGNVHLPYPIHKMRSRKRHDNKRHVNLLSFALNLCTEGVSLPNSRFKSLYIIYNRRGLVCPPAHDTGYHLKKGR